MNNVCWKLFPGKKHDSLLQTEIIKKCVDKNHVYARVPPSLSLILTTMIYYLNHRKCGCF